MEWKEIGQTIASAAPVLGGILAGPIGAAVGGAASLVASALGCGNDPEEVMETIKNNPESLIRLKEIESQNLGVILQWQSAQIEAEVEDRKSARQASVDGNDRCRLFWLSIFLFCIAFGLEGILLFYGFAQGISGELVGRVMGTVDTMAVMILSFWYGASRSGQNTESLLYHSTPSHIAGGKNDRAK